MKEKRYVCFFSRLFIDKETDKLVYIDDIANEQDLLIKEEVEQKLFV